MPTRLPTANEIIVIDRDVLCLWRKKKNSDDNIDAWYTVVWANAYAAVRRIVKPTRNKVSLLNFSIA